MDGQGRICQPARSLGIPCCCSMNGMDADAEILALMQEAGEVHLEGIQPDSFIHWGFVVRQTLCDLFKETRRQRGTFIWHTILLQNLNQTQCCSSLLHPINVCLPLLHFQYSSQRSWTTGCSESLSKSSYSIFTLLSVPQLYKFPWILSSFHFLTMHSGFDFFLS